jgi:hypothetical protein
MSRNAWIGLGAGVLILTASVAGALLARGSTGSKPEAQSPPPPTTGRGFSLPLAPSPGTLALAKHEGNLLVGIAAHPGGPVEVAVLRAETPVATAELRIEIEEQSVETRPCGRGCSRVEAPVLDGSAARLSVRAGSSSVTFALPARLPPAGDEAFARAERTMERLHSFRFTEKLSSGGKAVFTKLDVQAPNRLRIRTSSGFRSVIIGRARWDNAEGHWERVPFPGLAVAGLLMWSRAKHPRIVGRRPGGVQELAAFGLQPVPSWFHLSVGPSGRVLDAEMLAASHFMVHRYSDFNGDVSITPPVGK